MKKIIKMILFLLLFIVLLYSYFFIWWSGEKRNITWGVDFSQLQTEALGLNWKETYLALLDDLHIKNIKIHTQWDFVEGKKNQYFFNDIDWQIQQAKQRNVKIIYVVGMKTGRWPECHIPQWASPLGEEQQQENLLQYIKEVVLRYKDSSTITYWQVENEPLLHFGQCPSWYYKDDSFLKKEVELVKSLDSTRQIIVSDSGELSSWFNASRIGDILGTTMYRRAWVNISNFGFSGKYPGFYGTYPIPPIFYFLKTQLIGHVFNKRVMCIELQAEPWGPDFFYNLSLQEQAKTMDLAQFKANITYAKKTGLDTFYLWGSEWWYWMKVKQDKPEIWNEAKTLFN